MMAWARQGIGTSQMQKKRKCVELSYNKKKEDLIDNEIDSNLMIKKQKLNICKSFKNQK